MKAAQLRNEKERVEALRRYHILDTLPEQEFDDLALLAAQICGASISFITFIDSDRQWFKSTIGLKVQEIPRYMSLCSQAILPSRVIRW